ncbi:tripartite tricarboxylate transporter substrate binding protein [Bordetella sp. BOR01]|uniref:Bug family tripartite tricarboxylate transporter substrate binding protein n=1 Tax=Bordetella sp. BOR01 TaxID=2854779 RepID=UPI001C455D0C|nr:tripartite tricarboxylate transporter substrate binding protein [Bordetella sp. BOR01]MBV7484874.1 tripartite tricarboxylate transporter substrate binding protein [Bordetella sp. BOR01]
MPTNKLLRPLAGMAIAASLLMPAASTAASKYPSMPIRFVIGFSPGGSTDIIGRILAKKMSDILGQPIVVENRAGADSLIATQFVAQAQNDGYTLLVASGSHSINPTLYPDSKVDPVKDFAPIGLIGSSPNFLVVHPSVPAKSAAELIALAKADPGKYNSATSASTTFLATELFKKMAGINTTSIPYKGAGPATLALLAGEVQYSITSLTGMLTHVQSGKARALAVTGAQRSPLAPDVPTINEESVPGYVASTWYGMFAPAGTSADILRRLSDSLHEAMDDPEVRKQLEGQGMQLKKDTPEEFSDFVSKDTAKWAQVIRDSNAQAAR